MLKISSTFDSGAIEVVRIDDPADIRLRLRKDNAADFHQWFHFRLMGAAGKPVRMVFENAASAAYPDGWKDYRCVASYDRQNWFRIAGTRYEDGQLVVEHTPERDSLYYAYFEPYSHERHLDLLCRAEMSPFARVLNLGATVEGRDLDLVVVGRPTPERAPVWIIAISWVSPPGAETGSAPPLSSTLKCVASIFPDASSAIESSSSSARPWPPACKASGLSSIHLTGRRSL